MTSLEPGSARLGWIGTGVMDASMVGHLLDAETVLESVSGGAAGSWSLSNMEIALEEARRMDLARPGLALAHEPRRSSRPWSGRAPENGGNPCGLPQGASAGSDQTEASSLPSRHSATRRPSACASAKRCASEAASTYQTSCGTPSAAV